MVLGGLTLSIQSIHNNLPVISLGRYCILYGQAKQAVENSHQ